MKKVLLMLCPVCVLLGMVVIWACSSDNSEAPQKEVEEETVSVLEKEYFSVEGATYTRGSIPTATTEEEIEGLSVNSQALTGGMNFITIVTEEEYAEFYIGVEDVDGYFTYVPEESMSESEYRTYSITVMYSTQFNVDMTMIIGGKTKAGDIKKPQEKRIEHVDSEDGAININLTFSNAKDVDLHLYMPDNTHIYYGNRGGTVNIDGEDISYGLDHDSNPACYIDNLNNENIYIPEELVQTGTYKVVVNMYSNCDSSISTNWAIVTRYKGNIIPVDTGTNPAMGVYPVGAGRSDFTEVMTFHVEGTRSAKEMESYKITPIPLTEMDELKLEEEAYR